MHDTESSNKNKSMEDRFSELPEPLTHTILSYLPTRDVMNVSFLSNSLMQTWRSSPFIDLDETCYSKRFIAAGNFLRLVKYCFQQRQQDADILKFRLVLESNWPYIAKADSQIENIIQFVLTRKVRELELSLSGGIYCVPDAVFSSKYVKTLSLTGDFKLEKRDITVCHPLLENFFMTYRGDQLKTIKVSSSCDKLSNIVLEIPQGLEELEVEAKNLKTLKVASPCQINASSCTKLTTLKLHSATITDISMFRLVSTLVLRECNGTRLLHLSSDYLRKVKLDCAELVNICIAGQKLRSFAYRGHNEPCTINIKACKFIRSLVLENAHITDGWLKDHLPEFLMLQNLTLRSCASVTDITISNPKLQTAELSYCDNLESVLIDSQNLRSFDYSGSVCPSVYIMSPHYTAKLCLEGNHRAADWYQKLRHFLVSFGQCKELTLDRSSKEILIFPEKERQKMNPPLHCLKNLRITEILLKSEDSTNLVNSMLWAAPRLETLYFGSDSSTTLKLKYSRGRRDPDAVSLCCDDYTCWRHYVEEVGMRNLGADLKRKMLCYFTDGAKSLKKIDLKTDDREAE